LPTKAQRVLNRIREARDGRLNSAEFGERMRGKGEYWQAQERLFRLYCKRLGFNQEDGRRTYEREPQRSTFRRPSAQGVLFE
jgi:DNA repair photolyase